MSCENWVTLKESEDYEINCDTLQIRRKSNHRIVKESVDKSNGYIICCLNCKKYKKHRIIANNFIENPDNYKYVDHVNHDRTDNRICNLRWVSQKLNNNNRSDQEFVEEISDEAIVVDKYNDHEFEFLYFDPETNDFYVYNGLNYVVKPKYQNKNGFWKINIHDKNNKSRAIYYNKFKKQYGLI